MSSLEVGMTKIANWNQGALLCSLPFRENYKLSNYISHENYHDYFFKNFLYMKIELAMVIFKDSYIKFSILNKTFE